MALPKNNDLLKNARALRKEMTPQESRLWYRFLRTYPVKIYKQRIIGEYIVDFYCHSSKLVIEIDGSQHYDPQGIANDKKRTAYLESLGLKVIRFSNADINVRFATVCEEIDKALSVASGDSSPSGGAHPLPLGEVARQSRDGEGAYICITFYIQSFGFKYNLN